MVTAFLRQLQQEFKGYNGQKLAKDLMAGLTVAAVALPLALAFGLEEMAVGATFAILQVDILPAIPLLGLTTLLL